MHHIHQLLVGQQAAKEVAYLTILTVLCFALAQDMRVAFSQDARHGIELSDGIVSCCVLPRCMVWGATLSYTMPYNSPCQKSMLLWDTYCQQNDKHIQLASS